MDCFAAEGCPYGQDEDECRSNSRDYVCLLGQWNVVDCASGQGCAHTGQMYDLCDRGFFVCLEDGWTNFSEWCPAGKYRDIANVWGDCRSCPQGYTSYNASVGVESDVCFEIYDCVACDNDNDCGELSSCTDYVEVRDNVEWACTGCVADYACCFGPNPDRCDFNCSFITHLDPEEAEDCNEQSDCDDGFYCGLANFTTFEGVCLPDILCCINVPLNGGFGSCSFDCGYDSCEQDDDCLDSEMCSAGLCIPDSLCPFELDENGDCPFELGVNITFGLGNSAVAATPVAVFVALLALLVL